MKVKEYIELLKQFPQDLEVAQEYDSMYFTPDKPKRMKLLIDRQFTNTFLEADDEDEKTLVVDAVVI